MGFGIALIGYAFLILNEIGGAVFAAPLLAYGFFLASRLNPNFLRASITALFMFPRGIVQALSAAGVIDLAGIPFLNYSTYIVHLVAWLGITYFWCTGVIQIARDNNALKLENQARNRMLITVMFLMFSLIVGIFNSVGIGMGAASNSIAVIQYFLQYVIIIMNTWFMHTCFILITSEKQYEKDRQDILKERAKAIEKKHKEQQEAANRIGRNKK